MISRRRVPVCDLNAVIEYRFDPSLIAKVLDLHVTRSGFVVDRSFGPVLYRLSGDHLTTDRVKVTDPRGIHQVRSSVAPILKGSIPGFPESHPNGNPYRTGYLHSVLAITGPSMIVSQVTT